MSKEKRLHTEHLLKQSSRIDSSDTAEGTDKKPLGAHDAAYSLLRTAELAASLRRRQGKGSKRKLYRPGRIRLRVDEDVPERPPKTGNIPENRTRLRFSEDARHSPLHTPTSAKTSSSLLSEAIGKRLRFERPKRGGAREINSRATDRVSQYRSQQQRFTRLRFSQRSRLMRRDFTFNVPEIISPKPLPESTKRQLRFERPSRILAGDSSQPRGGILTQNERRQRLRFSSKSVSAQSGTALETMQPPAARLVSEPTKRRLRFEKLGRGLTGEHNQPSSGTSGQQTLRINSQQSYKRLRFGQPNRLWQPGTAGPAGGSRLRPPPVPGLGHLRRESHALRQSGQTGLTPVAGPPEASLCVTAMKQQAYGTDSRYYTSYTVWEELKTPRFLDNGEKRKSRLKFEDDRKSLLGSGSADQPLNNGKDKLDTKKKIRKGGFFASALRNETDRMLDEIARSTEDPAVEGANAERKVASTGSRYGLKYGREWRGNHDNRVTQREIKRVNKQYVRDLKEQLYQQQHGRPPRSARWRETVKKYGRKAHKVAEQKLGAKATAEIEKIIAIIAKKGAALIRVAVAYVGAPLIGIILAFLLLFLLALLFVGGINNSAITVLTAYTAEDTEIEAASSYYTKLEAELDKEIKNISTAWEWQHIDQFHFDLDDIGHDPYQLMAYLSVKYPGFTFSDVQTELDYIFDQRYTLTTHQWYEWRGKSPHRYKYYHLDVTLRAKPMEPILRQELAKDTKNDLVSWYGVLMETKGAHQAYANPFDIDWSGNVSSLYGYRVDPIGEKELQQHRGVDIAMPTGTPIRAGLSGTVRYVGHDNIMGNYIILDADGVEHTMKYGHCDEVRVSAGEKVVAGETVIGTVGNSGQSTGPHLHLEILENGEYVNPIYSLNYKEKTS